MPRRRRRKPFTLPLTAAERLLLDRLHEEAREALAGVGRGDYTILNRMRECAREIMRRKHDALSHPHTEASKTKIGLASRARAGAQRREPDTGRFAP